jgi:hypothetical protein
MGLSAQIEQPWLWWYPAVWQPGYFCHRGFFIQVRQNLLNDHRILDAGKSLPRERSECFGYHLDGTTAGTAGLDIDVA